MCAPNGLSTSFYATRIKKEKWLGNELERKILKVVGGCFAEYSHATRQILASRRQTVHGSELGTYIHHQLHHRRQRGYWGQTLNVRLTDWLWEMKTRKANITLRGRGGDGYLNLATVISCGRKFLRSLRCQASTILTSEIIAVLENSVFEGGGETELGNCRS